MAGGVGQHVERLALVRRTVQDDSRPQSLGPLAVPLELGDRRHRERAEALGATVVMDRTSDPDEPLYVLTDPAGHPFCLLAVSR